MPISPALPVDVRTQELEHVSDPEPVPIAKRVEGSLGELYISGGRWDLPVHHGGTLYIKHATLTAPIFAGDFGAHIRDSSLQATAGAGPALSTRAGELCLNRSTVDGDIIVNHPRGYGGVSLAKATVKGDIRSAKVQIGSKVTVQGCVHVAAEVTRVGTNCSIDVIAVSPPKDRPHHPPELRLDEGTTVQRVICCAPTMTLKLTGNASVLQPLADSIQVERLPSSGRAIENDDSDSDPDFDLYGGTDFE